MYQDKEYPILLDTNGDCIPTTASDQLEDAVATTTDLTAFSFSGVHRKTYLFDSEMAGYKYYEEHVDKEVGRKIQIRHAINTLRDRLMATYGLSITRIVL